MLPPIGEPSVVFDLSHEPADAGLGADAAGAMGMPPEDAARMLLYLSRRNLVFQPVSWLFQGKSGGSLSLQISSTLTLTFLFQVSGARGDCGFNALRCSMRREGVTHSNWLDHSASALRANLVALIGEWWRVLLHLKVSLLQFHEGPDQNLRNWALR